MYLLACGHDLETQRRSVCGADIWALVMFSMVEVDVKSQNATIVGSWGLCGSVATRGAASFPRTLDLARVSPHPTRAKERPRKRHEEEYESHASLGSLCQVP